MPPEKSNLRRPALTLVELLVTLAIIGVLISLLMPGLNGLRQQSRAVVCLSNLRQMATAAQIYVDAYEDSYPLAEWQEIQHDAGLIVDMAWDFTTIRKLGIGGEIVDIRSGLLWQGQVPSEIQQCPVFRGPANWLEDPHTGYNYNTSYIGHGFWSDIQEPSKYFLIRTPALTALFGDGEYARGANKLMRAPWPNPADASFFGRHAGTQGYRHRGKTNVAFCDGHAEPWMDLYTETSSSEQEQIAEGTGFLSPDNRLYDLE